MDSLCSEWTTRKSKVTFTRPLKLIGEYETRQEAQYAATVALQEHLSSLATASFSLGHLRPRELAALHCFYAQRRQPYRYWGDCRDCYERYLSERHNEKQVGQREQEEHNADRAEKLAAFRKRNANIE